MVLGDINWSALSFGVTFTAFCVAGVVYVVSTHDGGDSTQKTVAKLETKIDAMEVRLESNDSKQRERLARMEATTATLVDAVNRIDRTIMATVGKVPVPSSGP